MRPDMGDPVMVMVRRRRLISITWESDRWHEDHIKVTSSQWARHRPRQLLLSPVWAIMIRFHFSSSHGVGIIYLPLEQLVVSVSSWCRHLLSLVLMTGDDTTYVSAWQKTDVWWEQLSRLTKYSRVRPNRGGGMMRVVNPYWSNSRNQERREQREKIWMTKIKWRLFCSKSPVYCLQKHMKTKLLFVYYPCPQRIITRGYNGRGYHSFVLWPCNCFTLIFRWVILCAGECSLRRKPEKYLQILARLLSFTINYQLDI